MKFNKLAGCFVMFAASTCMGQMYTVTDLGKLHIGDVGSVASGINESGQVVGVGYSIEGGSTAHAFRTAPNRPINPVTDDFGPGTTAIGINSSGQVVGEFRFPTLPSNGVHAFRTAPNRRLNPATDDLGTVSYDTSTATGINDSGQGSAIT